MCDARATLTYGELNRRANEVAHRLMLLGVGAEKTVAVCMERSVEMIVAWLGVLKAGGAFVPLDPAYPKDRLAFQLGDCGAAVLLVDDLEFVQHLGGSRHSRFDGRDFDKGASIDELSDPRRGERR